MAAKNHMNRCSMLLVTREIQVKTTVRYDFRLTRINVFCFFLKENNTCW